MKLKNQKVANKEKAVASKWEKDAERLKESLIKGEEAAKEPEKR